MFTRIIKSCTFRRFLTKTKNLINKTRVGKKKTTPIKGLTTHFEWFSRTSMILQPEKMTNPISQNLRTRFQTGMLFSVVMLTGMFLKLWTFKILFSVILLGCLYEFFKMLLEKVPNLAFQRLRTGIAIGFSYIPFLIINFRWFDRFTSNLALVVGVLTFLCVAFLLLIVELFAGSEKPFHNIGVVFLAFFYLCVPFSMISLLKFDQLGYFSPNIAWGVMLLTWSNDSFAYLVGSRLGKTPFFPRISPKKTWEGTLGGVVGCFVVAIVFSKIGKPYYFEMLFDRSPALSMFDWCAIAAIVGIFGTLGDLVESMLKRSAGVKDSGTFMPGHGGFLDRFDAFLFAIPFVVMYLVLKYLI
ncbi:MAG: hypothetical protein RL757_2657 [Bacteroidota bacterium]